MVQKAASDLTLVEAFRRLRECGFDGLEPSLSQVPVDSWEEWLLASQESGLIIDGMVGGRPGNLVEGLEMTKRLGGDSLLVVVPYDHNASLQAQWADSRDRLRDDAAEAERFGVKLLVENVWATFLISPFDMVKFIDEIDSPWVQVHFDVGNMMRWGVAEHWAEVLGSRSQKLDVKEYDLTKAMNEGMRRGFDTPLGEGSINWTAVREQLAKIDYRGWAAAEVKAGDWQYLADVSRRMDQVLDLS